MNDKPYPSLSKNIQEYSIKNGIPVEDNKKKKIYHTKKWYSIKNGLIILAFLTYHIFYNANMSAVKCNDTKQWSYSIGIVIFNFFLYIVFIILVVNMLPGFFQPFSNVIGYTIIISPILRQFITFFFKILSFMNYIPFKSTIKKLIQTKSKKIDNKLFDIHDILKTLLLNPKMEVI